MSSTNKPKSPWFALLQTEKPRANRPVIAGGGSPNSVLSAADVIAIRERYERGGITHKELGAEYGVSGTTIGGIIRRKRWKGILGENNG